MALSVTSLLEPFSVPAPVRRQAAKALAVGAGFCQGGQVLSRTRQDPQLLLASPL